MVVVPSLLHLWESQNHNCGRKLLPLGKKVFLIVRLWRKFLWQNPLFPCGSVRLDCQKSRSSD